MTKSMNQFPSLGLNYHFTVDPDRPIKETTGAFPGPLCNISTLRVLTREKQTSRTMVSLQQMTIKSSPEEGPQTLAAPPSSCPPDYKDFSAIPLNARYTTVHTDT